MDVTEIDYTSKSHKELHAESTEEYWVCNCRCEKCWVPMSSERPASPKCICPDCNCLPKCTCPDCNCL